MQMPKAAVYKNHRVIMRKHNVGLAPVARIVLAEAEPAAEKLRAQAFFKRSIGTADM